MVYYPKPLHMQTAFAHLGYKQHDFPVSVESSERIFSLPMHGYLHDDQLVAIAESLAQRRRSSKI